MKLPFSKEKRTGDEVLDKIERLEQALQEKKPRLKPGLAGILSFSKKKKPAELKLGEEQPKIEEGQLKQEQKPGQEERDKPKEEEKKHWREEKPLVEAHLPRGLAKLKALKGKMLLSRKKKRRFDLRRFVRSINLQSFLEKAGLERLDAKKVSKTLFRINIIICGVISFIITIMNISFSKGLLNLVIFLLGFWLTVFLITLAVIWGAYLFYLDMRIFNRTKAVEAVFPDFLQLTSANISAGMPIDRALWYAVRPGFGVLAKEIETVAKNTMAGEDLSSALTNFANKYNSKIIQRSISLLLEGMAAGGELADLLNKVAMNIEETKLIKKEMASSVTTYVIFIIFATIIAAPVLFGLSTQLLEVIKAITGRLGPTMSSSGSMMGFSFSGEAIKTKDFRIFAYLMLSISAFSSACIISIIRKGRVKDGLAQIPVFIIVSLLIYTFASLLIKGMFSSIL